MSKEQGIHTPEDAYDIIAKEISRFEDMMVQRLRSLERRIKDRTSKTLVSARVGAKASGLTEAAIRQAARRGAINKYNGDGSRKITNEKTLVFFCLHEINERMNVKIE